MSYRKRPRRQYTSKKAVKLWVQTAQNLSEGKGIPRGTRSYKNRYGEPLVKPEPLEGVSMNPATSLVTAGFCLFGPHWLFILQSGILRSGGFK